MREGVAVRFQSALEANPTGAQAHRLAGAQACRRAGLQARRLAGAQACGQASQEQVQAA